MLEKYKFRVFFCVKHYKLKGMETLKNQLYAKFGFILIFLIFFFITFWLINYLSNYLVICIFINRGQHLQ